MLELPKKTVIFQKVQDIEFIQIEMKVIEGLKLGNECLKSMHEVGSWTFLLLCLEKVLLHSFYSCAFNLSVHQCAL